MCPGNEFFQRLFGSLGRDFNAAVGAIFDPSTNAKTLGFLLRRGSKINALDKALHHEMHLLLTHRFVNSSTDLVEDEAGVQFWVI